VDGRADIYALGATLYTLITGSPLYNPTTPLLKLLDDIYNGNYRPLEERTPILPRPFYLLVQKMLVADRQARYQSMEAVANAIEDFRRGKTQTVSQRHKDFPTNPCPNHPHGRVIARCLSCQKRFCLKCLYWQEKLGGSLCKSCMQKEKPKEKVPESQEKVPESQEKVPESQENFSQKQESSLEKLRRRAKTKRVQKQSRLPSKKTDSAQNGS